MCSLGCAAGCGDFGLASTALGLPLALAGHALFIIVLMLDLRAGGLIAGG